FTGTNLLTTGNTYTTPFLNTSATYYVESGVGSCRSSRVAVNAIINPNATVAANNVSRCENGSVVLTATSNSAGNPFFWYDAASGGGLVASSNSFTTPMLSSNTTYYVEAGTTCKSQRIGVTAIINHHGSVTTND